MQFTFADALRRLGPDAAFTLINGARTPANYIMTQFLPERNIADYKVEGGSMIIRPLMAGLVAMDSPYPESSAMEASSFLHNSAKIASSVYLPEAILRRLQAFVAQMNLTGGDAPAEVTQTVLNFTQTMLIQPHQDTAEYLRAEALWGKIDWTYNNKRLQVDYGIPTGNKLTKRTGNDAYGGSTSKFWDDNRAALKALRYNRRAVVTHSDTYAAIVENPANNIQVVAESTYEGGGTYSLVRMIGQNGQNTPSPDRRDRITIITYDREAEIIDPADNSKTLRLPFLKPGRVLHLGANTQSGFVVGQGAQRTTDYELGYTHIAPTVESGGQVGRWGRVFTPENQPWSLRGEAVQNLLPVIDAPDKIVTAETVLA